MKDAPMLKLFERIGHLDLKFIFALREPQHFRSRAVLGI